MINLLNKFLSKFNLQITSKQEEKPDQELNPDLLDKITTNPEFLRKHPEFLDRYLKVKTHPNSLYIGDINYIKDKNGKTYYQDEEGKYFCDYDMKNPSQEVLGHMIAETTFTKEQLEEKLKND